jgi:hypothetical protein
MLALHDWSKLELGEFTNRAVRSYFLRVSKHTIKLIDATFQTPLYGLKLKLMLFSI